MNRTSKDASHCNTNFRLDKEKDNDSQRLDVSHHAPLYKKIRTQILKSGCFEGVKKILVGISGGVDSAVLLHLLSEYRDRESGPTIVALHINHRQRGHESDRDESIAHEIAKQHRCVFHAISLQKAKKGMSEDELRGLRHQTFTTFAKEKKIQRIVLAHHMDDQVETFLFRLIRGADARGLSSMKVFQEPFARPLLYCRRSEILAEAEGCKIPYIEDSSNFFTAPSRNFIRKVILPALETKLDPQTTQHLFDLSLSMGEIDSYISKQAIEIIEKIRIAPHTYPVAKMREISPVVRKKMIQLAFEYIIKDRGSLSRDHIEMIDHWMDAPQSPKVLLLPQNIRVEKSKGVLTFRPA